MKGIEDIYVINSEGKLILSVQFTYQITKIFYPEALSNLLSLLETVAQTLGEEEISSIELGESSIYSSIDKFSKILFVIKCDKSLKKKMFQLY